MIMSSRLTRSAGDAVVERALGLVLSAARDERRGSLVESAGSDVGATNNREGLLSSDRRGIYHVC